MDTGYKLRARKRKPENIEEGGMDLGPRRYPDALETGRYEPFRDNPDGPDDLDELAFLDEQDSRNDSDDWDDSEDMDYLERGHSRRKKSYHNWRGCKAEPSRFERDALPSEAIRASEMLNNHPEFFKDEFNEVDIKIEGDVPWDSNIYQIARTQMGGLGQLATSATEPGGQRTTQGLHNVPDGMNGRSATSLDLWANGVSKTHGDDGDEPDMEKKFCPYGRKTKMVKTFHENSEMDDMEGDAVVEVGERAFREFDHDADSERKVDFDDKRYVRNRDDSPDATDNMQLISLRPQDPPAVIQCEQATLNFDSVTALEFSSVLSKMRISATSLVFNFNAGGKSKPRRKVGYPKGRYVMDYESGLAVARAKAKGPPWNCEICNHQLPSFLGLVNHIRHNGCSLACRNCHLLFPPNEKCQPHLQQRACLATRSTTLWGCGNCYVRFAQRRYIVQHYKSNSCLTRYTKALVRECPRCCQIFSRADVLMRHLADPGSPCSAALPPSQIKIPHGKVLESYHERDEDNESMENPRYRNCQNSVDTGLYKQSNVGFPSKSRMPLSGNRDFQRTEQHVNDRSESVPRRRRKREPLDDEDEGSDVEYESIDV